MKKRIIIIGREFGSGGIVEVSLCPFLFKIDKKTAVFFKQAKPILQIKFIQRLFKIANDDNS